MHLQHGMAVSSSVSSNGNAHTNGKAHEAAGAPGMHVPPCFCPEGVDPFDTTAWELRSAQIKDENGKVLFEQKNCEIPANWSPLATNVVVSKYFYGEAGTPERETSVRQVIHRVSRTIASELNAVPVNCAASTTAPTIAGDGAARIVA